LHRVAVHAAAPVVVVGTAEATMVAVLKPIRQLPAAVAVAVDDFVLLKSAPFFGAGFF